MKKKVLNKQLLFVAFLFCATKCFSQNKKLSIEANLPVLLGQNFLADNYTGIFDLGIAYTFEEFNSVKLGGSLNTSFLKDTNNSRLSAFDVRVFAIQPKIFAEFGIASTPNLHFKTGLGYSLFIFDLVPNENTTQFDFNTNTADNQNGLALSLGTVYDFSNSFFATFQYEFVKLLKERGVPTTAYNTNLNILKIGVGFKI